MPSSASGSKQGPLFAPLVLRVALGVTFIWAGLGKLVPIVEYKGQDAAILANLGTGIAPTHTAKPTGSATDTPPGGPSLAPPPTLPLPDAPTTPPPGGAKPSTSGKAKPSGRQHRAPAEIGSASHGTVLAALSTDDLPAVANAAKTKARSTAHTQPPTSPATPPAAANKPVQASGTQALPPGGKYTAADFPEPARARRAYSLSVLMVHAAYPEPLPGQPAPKSYWPKMLAESPWVVWLSFGAAVIELFAGVLVIVGFLTRLSAGMLVLVMLNAMWLTQIGPALSAGQTQFGFLPDKTWWDAQQWSTFMWQMLIIASGIALSCMGSGAVSVDRALAVIGSSGPKSESEPPAKG